MDLLRTNVGVSVTEYFEQIKTVGLPLSADALDDVVAGNLEEKPAAITWITWDDMSQMIQDGIAVGVYMSIDELIHCDLEDVMAVVINIVTAVFQRVQIRYGRMIETETQLAHEAARKIQGVWRNAISNPAYSLCKQRLMNEFNSM